MFVSRTELVVALVILTLGTIAIVLLLVSG
jgi:hypothetical protein